MPSNRLCRASARTLLARSWGKVCDSLGLGGGSRGKLPPRPFRLESLEDRTVPSLTPAGGQFAVNTYTTDTQQTSFQSPQAVASDDNGDFVVTWSSHNQDGSGWGVYARRYNAAGVAQGGEFRVNATTAGDQEFSSVAMNPSTGDFVITWSSHNQDGSGWGVYGQLYNRAGVAQGGEFRVNTTTPDDQMFSTVAMEGDGDFVITWSSHNQDGSGWGVYGQRYNRAGVAQGGEFRVNSTTQGDQEYSAVAMDAGGNFVITWSDLSGNNPGVYAQRYSAAGVAQGGQFQVDASNHGDQDAYSTVAVDPTGNFVVTWSSLNQDGDGWGVYGQRYDASGAARGGQFQVNSTTKKDQEYSTVAVLPDGGFLVTWSSDKEDGDGWGIFAQRYDASGVAQGGEFLVNAYTHKDQEFSSVAASTSGNVVVVWSGEGSTDDAGVYGQRYVLPGITVTPTSGLTTTEAGGTATFTVVLNVQPTAAVSIGLSSSDTSAGTLSTSGLVFTPSNWNVPQTVTITGVDDHVVTSNRPYTILVAPAVSADPSYNGLDAPDVSVTDLETDTAGITVTPTSGLVTSKVGGTATFRVVLTSQPTADVTVPLASSNTNEGVLSTPSLTFTPANWDVPQTVTVTGVNDFTVGDVPYTVSVGPAGSGDPNYSGVSGTTVSLTNRQTATPGITVTPTSGLTTTESGGTATFTVVLNSPPAFNVDIGLSSSDTTAGTVSTPNLTFTPFNWNVPQTVTITGVDDHVVAGNRSYTIVTAPAVSADLAYNNLDPADVAVTNRETDVAGVTVTPTSGLTTSQAGGAATFSVVLTSKPTANVTIGLSSSDPNSGTVSAPSLTFTPADWNVPQTVAVTGVDDHVVSGDVSYVAITAPAVSTDPNYSGLDPADVSVTNHVTDVAGIRITPTSGLTTTEAGGTAVFTVALTSKPAYPVTLTLASSDTVAGGTLSATSLIFDATNWNVPQAVTVTGVDDQVVTADTLYQVTSAGASADPYYNGLGGPTVALVNRETDVAGVRVTPASRLVTTSAGGTATFRVVLTSRPTANVVLHLASSDPSAGTLSTASLVFTPFNWNTPQVVTVTGVDNPSAAGHVSYNIVFAPVSSADGSYNGLTVAALSAVNQQLSAAPAPASPAPSPGPAAPAAPPVAPLSPPAPPAHPAPITLLPLGVGGGEETSAPVPATTGSPVTPAVVGNPGGGILPVSLHDQAPAPLSLTAGVGGGGGAPVGPSVESSEAKAETGGVPRDGSPRAHPSGPVIVTPPAAVVPPQNPTPTPAPPAALPPPVVPVLPGAVPSSLSAARMAGLRADWLRHYLDEPAEPPEAADPTARKVADAVFIGGVAASAGYVFLSSRGGSFLLSALTARPLWKQFDPLEVLFAWETEKGRRRARGLLAEEEAEEEDRETLQSLVEPETTTPR